MGHKTNNKGQYKMTTLKDFDISLEPLHDINSDEKVDILAAVMKTGIWPGPALLLHKSERKFYNGSHRVAAIHQIKDLELDLEIPIVLIDEKKWEKINHFDCISDDDYLFWFQEVGDLESAKVMEEEISNINWVLFTDSAEQIEAEYKNREF